MHVGVFLYLHEADHQPVRLPHARGGVSLLCRYHARLAGSSPCTWGCFQIIPLDAVTLSVFPMHVGVFLICAYCIDDFSSLPHARGGVSQIVDILDKYKGSSPCTWGCFQSTSGISNPYIVFPMHVGVFLL